MLDIYSLLILNIGIIYLFVSLFYNDKLSLIENIQRLKSFSFYPIIARRDFFLAFAILLGADFSYGWIGTIISFIIYLIHPLFFEPSKNIYSKYIQIAYFVILILLIFINGITFGKTVTGSMESTIMVGDINIVNRFEYGIRDDQKHIYTKVWNKPKRGDIVTTEVPKYTDNRLLQIMNQNGYKFFKGKNVLIDKRLVATPHDSFYFKDARLYLHPSEGNKYIKDNYQGFEIIDHNGTLFIKEPYQKIAPKIQFRPPLHKGTKSDMTLINSLIL